MSGNAKMCPVSGYELKGHAELTLGDEVTAVNDCEVCGRYAVSTEIAALLAAMSDATRWNLLAKLETRSLPAGADGTVVLTPEHIVAPKGKR